MNLVPDREDAAVLFGVLVLAVSAVANMRVDGSVTSALTAVGVIVTALASYWKARSAAKSARESEKSARESQEKVAAIAAKASTDNTSKTVLVQTLTSERATWRAEMRDHAAELVMLLRASARAERADWQRVDCLRTGIRLRLNPAGREPATATPDRHERDRAVHAILDQLAHARQQDRPAHEEIADALEERMAVLIKREWEVSKGEAVSGTLAT